MPDSFAVGVDGSAASLIALRWALDAAQAHGAELIAVIAGPHSTGGSPESTTSLRHRRRVIKDDIVAVRALIREQAGAAPITVEVLSGSPTDVLLAISGRVQLVVIGGHGYSGWRDSFSASVSGQLVVHTRSALCVVRTIPLPPRRRILVGHDATSNGAAVRFAMAEAVSRSASVLIATTWHYPIDTRATSPEAAEILEEGASAAVAAIAAQARAAHPGVVVDTTVQLGYPVEILAELGEQADLTVVGSHGRSGFASLVVGSVAIGLLRRLDSPVVIVPDG